LHAFLRLVLLPHNLGHHNGVTQRTQLHAFPPNHLLGPPLIKPLMLRDSNAERNGQIQR